MRSAFRRPEPAPPALRRHFGFMENSLSVHSNTPPHKGDRLWFLAPAGAFALCFAVYLFTMAPGLLNIDSGELAAVQVTLGLAHATGYPLFTVLGWLFQQVPLGISPVMKANVLAALYCAGAVAVLVHTLQLVLLNLKAFRKAPAPYAAPDTVATPAQEILKQAKGKKVKVVSEVPAPVLKASSVPDVAVLSPLQAAAAAFAAGLTVAFSRTLWLQSAGTEVYSLHVLLVCLITCAVVRAYIFNRTSQWLFLAFVLALSFGNHLTTVVLGPGIAYLFFLKKGFKPDSLKVLALMLLLFFAVLSLEYGFLVLRALQNPVVNWGNPDSWDRFWYHVSGKQFSVWVFAGSAVAKRQFAHLTSILVAEFSWPGLLAAVAGLVMLFRKSRVLFVFTVLFAVCCIVFAVNYDIHDIDTYFLTAFIMAGFASGFAYAALLQSLPKAPVWLLGLLPLLVPVYQVQANYAAADQSKVYMYDDYTRTLLGSVEPNALIISKQWDFFLSQSFYYRFALNQYRGVACIDKELLRRSWYFHEIERQDPGLLKGVQPQLTKFLNLLEPFENGGVFNGEALSTAFSELVAKLIESNYSERPVYIAPEIALGEIQSGEITLPKGYYLEPQCFLLRVVGRPDMKYRPCNCPDMNIRFLTDPKNDYSLRLREIVTMPYIWRAQYELKSGFPEKAKKLTENALKARPDMPLPPDLQTLYKNGL